MNPKLISALTNAFVSFVVIVVLSFFMNKLINNSTQTFMEFFHERWMILVGFVLIFTIYNSFIKGRKIQK